MSNLKLTKFAKIILSLCLMATTIYNTPIVISAMDDETITETTPVDDTTLVNEPSDDGNPPSEGDAPEIPVESPEVPPEGDPIPTEQGGDGAPVEPTYVPTPEPAPVPTPEPTPMLTPVATPTPSATTEVEANGEENLQSEPLLNPLPSDDNTVLNELPKETVIPTDIPESTYVADPYNVTSEVIYNDTNDKATLILSLDTQNLSYTLDIIAYDNDALSINSDRIVTNVNDNLISLALDATNNGEHDITYTVSDVDTLETINGIESAKLLETNTITIDVTDIKSTDITPSIEPEVIPTESPLPEILKAPMLLVPKVKKAEKIYPNYLTPQEFIDGNYGVAHLSDKYEGSFKIENGKYICINEQTSPNDYPVGKHYVSIRGDATDNVIGYVRCDVYKGESSEDTYFEVIYQYENGKIIKKESVIENSYPADVPNLSGGYWTLNDAKVVPENTQITSNRMIFVWHEDENTNIYRIQVNAYLGPKGNNNLIGTKFIDNLSWEQLNDYYQKSHYEIANELWGTNLFGNGDMHQADWSPEHPDSAKVSDDYHVLNLYLKENSDAFITITFDGNGATDGTAPSPITILKGNEITIPGANNLSKENCTFIGWNTSRDGLGTTYTMNQSIAFENSTTLYAKWEIELPQSYKYSYKVNHIVEGNTVRTDVEEFEYLADVQQPTSLEVRPIDYLDYTDYVVDEVNTTIPETVAIEDAEINIYYEKDILGGTDPENPGDGTPDKYQRVVTYKVVNGTWSDDSVEPKTEVVTLLDVNQKPAVNGTATLVNVPTGMKAIDGYGDGKWLTKGNVEPTTVNDNVEFTYEFAAQEYNYSVRYFFDGKVGTAPEEAPKGGTGTFGSEATITPLASVTVDGNNYTLVSKIHKVTITTSADNNVIKVYYELDNLGGSDPENPGDGTPDKYQIKVSFNAKNGTFTNGETSIVIYLNKTVDGELNEKGTATLTKNMFPLVGEEFANNGYTMHDVVEDLKPGTIVKDTVAKWKPTINDTEILTKDKEFTFKYVEDTVGFEYEVVYNVLENNKITRKTSLYSMGTRWVLDPLYALSDYDFDEVFGPFFNPFDPENMALPNFSLSGYKYSYSTIKEPGKEEVIINYKTDIYNGLEVLNHTDFNHYYVGYDWVVEFYYDDVKGSAPEGATTEGRTRADDYVNVTVDRFVNYQGVDYVADFTEYSLLVTRDESKNIIKVDYYSDMNHDDIADKYQVRVDYEAVNGSLSIDHTYVTLKDAAGNLSETGVGHLTDAQIPTTSANDGYYNGTWDIMPTTELDITEDTTFTITYVAIPEEETDEPDDDRPDPVFQCPEGTVWNDNTGMCDAIVVPVVDDEGYPPVGPVNPGVVVPGDVDAPEVDEEDTTEVEVDDEPVETPEVVEIEDEETPEAGGRSGHWALINLIATIGGALLALILLIGKHEKDADEDDENAQVVASEMNEEDEDVLTRRRKWKFISTIVAVVSVVIFFLTENMSLPMVLVDKYTMLMLALFLGNVVCLYMGRRWHEEDDETEETA